MKNLFLVTALCGVWMLVKGASVITPDLKPWSNTTITEFQAECISKIQNEESIIVDISNLELTFLNIFMKITQKVTEQNFLDSLDIMINDICYPALDKDKLYFLTMQIFKICMNQDDPFTAEERQIIKTKLQRAFCSVYVKLATVIYFSSDCLTNEATENEISKCVEGQSIFATTIRDNFFLNSNTCNTISKIFDCVNQTIREQCSTRISEKIESILSEAGNIVGCEFEPNSISVINSL